MFSNHGKINLQQIDINAVEVQATGIMLVFAVLLFVLSYRSFKGRFGSNSFQHHSLWEIIFKWQNQVSAFENNPFKSQVHL